MVILREGIDRIHLTVRDTSHHEYKYSPEVAQLYADRLSRLKFADRYSNVIHFDKYPHFTWKYQGKEKSTYAVEYFIRLDGLRQMRVFLNGMRLYNVKKKLPLYDRRIWDDNVVIPSHTFGLHEFVDLVQMEIPEIIKDYIEIRHKVFQDDVIEEDVTIDTHQVEVVIEGIGLHTSDVSDTFKDFARCDSFKVYQNQSNTHYLNTIGRRQLKIYNKGIGILRLEATFNTRPQDIVFNWKEELNITTASIHEEMEKLLADMNIPNDWWQNRKKNRQQFIWALADGLGLREGGRSDGEVQDGLMKILLTITHWNSNRYVHDLTRRLVRKKLLQPIARGKYLPTQRLMGIQRMFYMLEKWEGVWEEQNDMKKEMNE